MQWQEETFNAWGSAINTGPISSDQPEAAASRSERSHMILPNEYSCLPTSHLPSNPRPHTYPLWSISWALFRPQPSAPASCTGAPLSPLSSCALLATTWGGFPVPPELVCSHLFPGQKEHNPKHKGSLMPRSKMYPSPKLLWFTC